MEYLLNVSDPPRTWREKKKQRVLFSTVSGKFLGHRCSSLVTDTITLKCLQECFLFSSFFYSCAKCTNKSLGFFSIVNFTVACL